MKTMQWDLTRAYEFVKERRPCISPNLHFMGQLLEFQKQLQESRNEQHCLPSSAIAGEEATDAGMDDNDLNSGAVTSGMYYDVSLFESVSSLSERDEDEFEGSRSSTATIPSASAPSSLNLDKEEEQERELMELEEQNTIQVLTEEASAWSPGHRTLTKPRTLALLKSSSVCEQPYITLATESSSLLGGEGRPRLHPSSVSLPNTPVSHYRTHLACRTPSPLPYTKRVPPPPPHPLRQHSPCRVVASLGSRSETCLSYFHHTPLAESK